jgi:hypothetical protein
MAEDGPWTKYQTAPKDDGPWVKYGGQGPEANRSTMGNVLAGLEEGVAGDIVGAGQLAERGVDYFAPGTSEAFKKAHPEIAERARFVKQETMRPTSSWAESISRDVGGAAPVAIGAMLMPEIGGAGWLANLARAALTSGAAGGVQPTQSGSAASHLQGAGEGLATGMVPLVGAHALHAGAPFAGTLAKYGTGAALAAPLGYLAHAAMHQLGVPEWAVIAGLGPLWLLPHEMRNTALAKAAAKYGKKAAEEAAKGVRTAGKGKLGETALGQYSGREDEGRDVYVHARPQ